MWEKSSEIFYVRMVQMELFLVWLSSVEKFKDASRLRLKEIMMFGCVGYLLI